MKQRTQKYLHAILALVLSLCLITGCSLFPNSTPETEKNTVLETTAKTADNSILEDPAAQPDKTALLAAQKAFDQFTENLFKQEAAQSLLTLHYTLADPESYGITDYDRTLGTALAEDTRRDMEDAKQVKAGLDAMDTRLLSKDQLLTYTILSSYINTLLSSDGLELYDQPLSTTLGIQSQLPILLSEYTFYKKQDIDDYLSLLSSIDTYYDSLIAFETQRAQAGLGLCDTVIDNIIRSCNAYLIDADHSFLAETFASRLNEMGGLSDQEKADYKAKNKKAIDEHFVPAYERLITGLEGLKGKGTNDKGLYYYPEGRKYYEYLVNASTGTSYSDVPALKQAINKQMAKELTAVNQLLNDDPSLGDKLDTSTFTLTKPQDILEDLKAQCQTDFPPVNDCNYTIKTVPKTLEGFLSPAFYLKVPIDRPEDNSIYINNKSTDSDSLYTTMAHEGYPGHMYQTLYFNQKNTCNLRNVLDFQGYTEGWGTYAEYYAFNLNNGLEENMGQLLQHNSAFTLALYALLDINIHYEGWNIDQVGEYLNMYFQLEDPSVISSIYYEVVENPANYLSYYTGYLELLNMQEEAKQQLGNNFSLLEFNRFILDIGPAPFSVIRNYFTQWLIQNSNNN